MKICDWFEDKIFDYVDGLLPGDRKKEIEKHFKECSSCLNNFNNAMNVRVQLRNLKPIKTSPDFETVLRTRISMERSLNRRRFVHGPVRIPMYAATGAIIALAAFFILSALNNNFLARKNNNTNLLAPSYVTNPNTSNNSSADSKNPSQNIHYPMDWVNISKPGTAINSTELKKFSSTRFDSAKQQTPKTVQHQYEF